MEFKQAIKHAGGIGELWRAEHIQLMRGLVARFGDPRQSLRMPRSFQPYPQPIPFNYYGQHWPSGAAATPVYIMQQPPCAPGGMVGNTN